MRRAYVGGGGHDGLMLLSRLVTTSADVASTRSRLAKRKFLADCIAESAGEDASGGSTEVELVVTYLSGSLRQRRTGVGWASLVRPAHAGRRT